MTRAGRATFAAWVVACLGGWALLVVALGHGQLVADNAGVALAMVLGSYVAGSTPMGGGTIGFPAMVLVCDFPAAVGRDFAVAIQSVGMTSASLLVFLSRRSVHGRLLGYGLLGSLVATPVALLWLAPCVGDGAVKLLFAVLCAGFGLDQLARLRRADRATAAPVDDPARARRVGLLVGVLGGSVSALVGVGIDVLAYAAAVLLLGCEVRRAIYTSIPLMAATSLIATATLGLRGGLAPEAVAGWWAAAPVVVLGAAAGTVVAGLVPRRVTTVVVAGLCLTQVTWTVYGLGLAWVEVGLTGLAVCGTWFALSRGLSPRDAPTTPPRRAGSPTGRRGTAHGTRGSTPPRGAPRVPAS